MLLSIVQAGEPVLRQRARPLEIAEIRSAPIQQLIEHMRETMRDAPGVGLAAPQVGLPLQIAVIEDPEDRLRDVNPDRLAETERRAVPFHVIVNPTITLGDETVEFFEGCLSVSRFGALVARARSVTVDCFDHRGEPVHIEATGWYARILQHEIDHLNGYLYVDRMQSRSFMSVDNFNRYWKDLPMRDVRKAFR